MVLGAGKGHKEKDCQQPETRNRFGSHQSEGWMALLSRLMIDLQTSSTEYHVTAHA